MTTTTATDEDVMVHHADCADRSHPDYDDCELDSWTDGQPIPEASCKVTANPGRECGPMATFHLGMDATDAEDLDAVLDALAELTGRALELKRRMAA